MCEASCKGSMEILRTFMGHDRQAEDLWAAPAPLGSLHAHFAIYLLHKQTFNIVFPTSFLTLNSS